MSAYELNKTILKDSANLKAYYRFESGALTTDSGANGYTLTNNNTVAEGSGKYGGGADFGASNTNKSFSYANGLVDLSNSAVSFSTWFNLTTAPGTGETQRILEWQSTVGTSRYLTLQYEDSAGVKRIRVDASNSTITYNTILSTGTWYHIAFTISAAGTVRVYLNGAHVATGSRSTGTTATNKIVYGNNDGGTVPVKGLMDDTAIFTTELSADQIKELYEGRYIGEWLPQSGLVFGTHLNGSGTDFSGNNLHLSPSGAGATFTLSGKISGCVDYGTGNTGKFLSLVNDATIRGGACTLLCWINTPTTTSANDHETFFAVGDQGTRVSYNIFLGTTGIGAARLKGGVAWQETAQKAISANIWYFAALTYDTTNVSLYVDGNLIGQQAASGTGTGDVVDSINIGARADTGAGVTFSDGKIDEAVIFSRALTAAEIRKWYAWSTGRYL